MTFKKGVQMPPHPRHPHLPLHHLKAVHLQHQDRVLTKIILSGKGKQGPFERQTATGRQTATLK